MRVPSQLYSPALGLLTDLYQLTMAYACWKNLGTGVQAAFNLQFRRLPFGSGYAVAAGLEHAADLMENFRFEAEDIDYLAGLTGSDRRPLFERGFLDYLAGLRFSCTVHAIPEGTAVFPYEPLLRVEGPLIEAQILETPLLNVINFQTLVATKAARICQAARGEPVLEFGLRRAQGIDGALAASRAAYVGGAAGTSNVLAGRLFGIPVRGTHAHSWVMLFGDEVEAFDRYAGALPANCTFLVDTYDTLEGVRCAAEAGRKLRERGHELLGVRLDSGDLGRLAVEARRILDEAGFPKANIVASNDLDERQIARLKELGAPIGVWGVGTRLVTAHDDPALGGVYKLAAVRRDGGGWEPRIKLSESPEKMSDPALLAVRRYELDGRFVADVIYDRLAAADGGYILDGVAHEPPAGAAAGDLLVPVFEDGRRVWNPPPLGEVRARAAAQLSKLAEDVRRLDAPARYPVGRERTYHARRAAMARNSGTPA